ncbi:MAG TPA: carboxypeptidase regulatory-like domain-containing protein [Terracidiphilus sp.]|nr:carboxypeptidase regulatory-like domain-containing protein [Terracidiphilus sp.]
MFSINRKAPGSNPVSRWFRQIPWLLVPLLALTVSLAHAQTLTATLSGIAADPSNARIPGAAVKIINQATNDVRTSKADGTGFFSVTALPPGTYTLEVSEKGFATFKETGIVLNQGDSRTVPNIHLQISSSVTAVTVISGENAEIPTDTAEISDTLNNELVDSATLTGRNAAELIKMMPGVAFNNAGNAGSAYNSQVTGTNNGPAGSFSANGTQPYGSTDVYLDGANLIDPGNAGTQVANINQDMTDSVKYLSASYDASYAKGPAVLEAFSKSGGQKYHGEAYLYARNTAVGYANDWNAKYLAIAGGGQPVLQPQSFYYIGGNVGGPVSFLGFNRNKDKLFFWGGYEKMIQHPYSSPVLMTVPTADQLKGDFNNAGVPAGAINQWPYAYALPCNTDDGWQGCNTANSPWGGYGTGTVPDLSPYFDPNGVIISNLNPAPNVTPNAANSWNNFQYAPSLPVNRWEGTGKLTYAFNDNNKLWGSYAYQTETDNHPLSIWWAPEWTVPYPSQPIGKETANLYLANYTHVFNATTTNEFVFAYAKFVNNNSLSNTAATSRKALGFPQESLYGTSNLTDQIPNFDGDWNVGITEINEFDFNSGIYGPNTFGKTSKAPSISDTFTKIVKSHSIKAGFYWDAQENLQANGSDTNGDFNVTRWGASDTYNVVLDRLMGRNGSYNETNLDAVPDLIWHEWSLWAQDSWKVNNKLTINVGLRADHEGQWYDKIGGTQVWDPTAYDNSANPAPNTGLKWTKIDSSIPTSGWKSQLFLYDPRVGFAYDVFGTGNTVVRGGFGTYRYQVSGNDASGAMGGPLGSYAFNTNQNGLTGFYGYNIQGGAVCTATTGGLAESCAANSTTQLAVPQGLNQNGTSGTKADALGDDRVPYADTWSFGVAQSLPGHTVAEVSYVGSMSRNQLLNGANGHIQDANPIGYGAFYQPDPQTGLYQNLATCVNDPSKPNMPCPNGPAPGPSYNAVPTHDYQALRNYGDLWIQTHGGYANYNSLQVSAQKQSGNLYLFTNFTFGKVLGTRDGSTSNGNGNGPVVDPFNLDANYGPLEYDHTKIFNFSASYKLPKPIHNNRLLGEVVNGWQLTTYTTYEDGAPYQTTSPNMNMDYHQFDSGKNTEVDTPITLPIPANSYALVNGVETLVGNQTFSVGQPPEWIGTSQPENGVQPVVICDPRKGLKKGQYFNPNCFAGPLPPTATTFGQEGQTIWPYIRTPHYFGSDLAVFKAFRITDSQRIELRISATNWLNHPNGQFGLNGSADNQLRFNGVSSGSSLTTNSNTSTTGVPNAKSGYRWMQFAAKYYF